jgi:hypothetical protein
MKLSIINEDSIPGGLADEASIGDIAAMHNVSVEEINDNSQRPSI